ncbi:MAG: N-acetylmuramoyl-L-alanine amidase [Thermomicrobiales bacterium]
MPYTTNTTIEGESRGSAGAIYQWALKQGCARPADVLAYLTTMYKLCTTNNIRAEVLISQSIHETTDVDTGAPWASYWWAQRCNPAGIGVTGDATQNNTSRDFKTGDAAARAHFLHAFLYAVGTDTPSGVSKQDDPRYDAALSAGYAGIAPTMQGFQNTWGIDNNYANAWVGRLNALDAAGLLTGTSTTTPPQEDTTVSDTVGSIVDIIKGLIHTTTVPGLPGGPLLTTYPIQMKLIPAWNTYQRPGIKAERPRRSVQHGTGNPSSMAAGEITWLVDSKAGGGQVSFHATADDTGVWIGVPLDEVSWQAADGGGPGNMNGFSCEMIENTSMWNDPARRTKAIAITADFMGRVAARLEAANPEQHYTFNFADPNRHDCPDKLRHVAGAWDAYVTQWNTSKADELARMKGGPVIPPAPAFDWSKAAKPLLIPALSDTDVGKNDTAPGVISKDGTDFVFVSDVVEATADISRLQYADAGSPRTGPDIKAGERFVGAWLFKAGDGSFYYLSSAPFWSRIPAKNTKRVADAPLKGTA